VRADGIKTALKDPLTKNFFQVGLDTASETLIVDDQGDTIAAHLLSPYQVGVGEGAARRAASDVVNQPSPDRRAGAARGRADQR
jgi:hypothetical protein